MFTNYFLYLNTLPKIEKENQIIMILLFFMIMMGIAGILAFVKYKYEGKVKNEKLKKFLEKI